MVDERSSGYSEQEWTEDKRHFMLDERERIADERERIADERERIADQRERMVDRRQHLSTSSHGHVAARSVEETQRRTAAAARALARQKVLLAVDVARQAQQHVGYVSAADGAIRGVTLADALFLLIGAEPLTDWLPASIARDEWGYVLTGAQCGDPSCQSRACSTRVDVGPTHDQHPPLLFETTLPGVFAVGDVRRGIGEARRVCRRRGRNLCSAHPRMPLATSVASPLAQIAE